ncbi:hypothetical protein LI328DRAFT_124858, partial [Trichoderma asperelloides]
MQKQNSNTNIVYPLMSHMLVIASRVQIYALLFSGDTNEIDIAKSRLESNFNIIGSLESTSQFSRLHSPGLVPSMNHVSKVRTVRSSWIGGCFGLSKTLHGRGSARAGKDYNKQGYGLINDQIRHKLIDM